MFLDGKDSLCWQSVVAMETTVWFVMELMNAVNR
jgi:hypothetical protein